MSFKEPRDIIEKKKSAVQEVPSPIIKRIKSNSFTAEKEGDTTSNKRSNRRRRSHKHPKDKKEEGQVS